jgi:anaerobic selenocysteine-containing dehydrogenase
MSTQVLTTTCPMDCPDTCALEVGVSDGRVMSIRGAKDAPVTNGYICDKVSRFDRRLYHEDRLLYPLRRTGVKGAAKFARISWDDAIAEITARFREISGRWGGEAILPYHYGGSNGFLSDGLLDDYFFAKLGASRLARTLCAAPAGAVALGMYGKMAGVAFEDYPHAKCILLWGGNPKASNIHLVPFLKRARRNGAFIAVVDPVRNFSPDEIDLHLPVYPGADLPVALAMIRHWRETNAFDWEFLHQQEAELDELLDAADAWPLERAAGAARVAAEEIRRLADTYAAFAPAVLRCGWGLERNRNGGQAIAAILAMPALLGKFGVRGGGYTLSNGGASKIETAKIFGPLDWATREVNMSRLGDVLTHSPTPPIRALFVYNCNPMATAPDQNAILRGLAREDLFTVVHEQVMTDTCAYADIVLPATTFLEHHDVRRGYGNYVIGGARPVVPAAGEAKPNEHVFALLGRAMGWQDAPFTWNSETWVQKIAAAMRWPGGPVNADTLLAGRTQRYDFPGKTPIQFRTVMPQTPDGRIHFTFPALGPAPYRYDPVEAARYPLALISPANNKMVSSTFGEFNYPELRVRLHPRDAAARGIAEGDTVRAFNDLGEVVCRAEISDRIREGVVSIPKGAWRKSSRNGHTATALCPATTGTAGGACFNDARVELSRV